MDRVELFKRIEGHTISITAKGFENVVANKVRISLDGEIQWDSTSWLPNWDAIGDIEEYEPGSFSFFDNEEECLISILD